MRRDLRPVKVNGIFDKGPRSLGFISEEAKRQISNNEQGTVVFRREEENFNIGYFLLDIHYSHTILF